MIKSEFVTLIDERDENIEYHFGDNMLEMLIDPVERKWYAENITPLDIKIVDLANNILQKKMGKLNKKVENIGDVYENQTLIDFYNEQKKEMGYQSNSSKEISIGENIMNSFKYITNKEMACKIISKVSNIPLYDKMENCQCEIIENEYYVLIEKIPLPDILAGKRYFIIHNDFEISVGNNVKQLYETNEIVTTNFRIQTAILSGKNEEYINDLKKYLYANADNEINSLAVSLNIDYEKN